MKKLSFLLCLLLLSGCAAQPAETQSVTMQPTAIATEPAPAETTVPETEPADPILELLGDTSLEQRVGQLFLARCNDATAIADIQNLHLGGFVLFGQDFEGQTPETLSQKLSAYQSAASIPMLFAVDEEGGTVTRISRNSAFRSAPFPSPRKAYQDGGLDHLLAVEESKCQLLSSLGIHVNLGPVCDIATQETAFMFDRSLGINAQDTANAVASTVRLMDAYRVGSVLKHFPGYGNNPDTHTGIAIDNRLLKELEEKDLVPFAAGFQAGADAVMVSHTIITVLDPTLPASLSPAVHDYIRNVMGYDGVIMTDDLIMQAVTDQYGAAEAAVLAVLAGNDLLCSTEYQVQYEAVLAAVLDGRIDIETLDNAVIRVLRWKQSLGLI